MTSRLSRSDARALALACNNPAMTDHPQHGAWTARVRHLEQSGCTTSDAQAIADAEWQIRRTHGCTQQQAANPWLETL